MLIASSIIFSYIILAVVTRTYFKLYRWDQIFKPDLFLVGLLWPFYWFYRIVSWPIALLSDCIENKMNQFQKWQEKRAKVRIEQSQKFRIEISPELEEAEEELNKFLEGKAK